MAAASISDPAPPRRRLALTALLVDDYDAAIAFYVGVLGFELRSDTALSPTKRWVVIAPPGGDGGLLLARADGETQRAAIGQQAGGRVFLFLETDDIGRDYAAWSAAGVQFAEAPRDESYGRVTVFADPYGNRWDLIERAGRPSSVK